MGIKMVTVNDLEERCGHYFALFGRNRYLRSHLRHMVADRTMLCV